MKVQVQWKKVLVKTTVWLAAEIILNSLGLDELADYSEFIYEQELQAFGHYNRQTIVTNFP
ncbi:MAG: hypothetical protein WA919_21290 [Coleofasciculaceae cyanobacterium]